MKAKRLLPTAIGLLVALVSPFGFSFYVGSVREQLADPPKVILALILEWVPTLVLLGLILFWERESLDSIGLRSMSWRDGLWGVVGWLVGTVAFNLSTPLVNALNLDTAVTGVAQLAKVPLGLRVAIVLTAGITEEILYRGYPIERLTALTGRLGLSATISYLLFVLLHVPLWGLGGALQVGSLSVVLTALYLWRRNLPACMLMHILNDTFAFIMLPHFFGQYLP